MARLIAAMIRHGDYHQLPHTPSAYQPFPLTERGIRQVHEGAESIRCTIHNQGWQLCPEVICSPLLRAWQTASILCQQLEDCFAKPPSIHQDVALCERGLGSAANLTVSQIERLLADDPRYSMPPENWKSNSYYRLPLPGAESLMQAGERVARLMRARMASLRSMIVDDRLQLFVGHGAAFRHAAHLLGVLEFEQIATLSMHHGAAVYLEYGTQGRWNAVAGQWKVRKSVSDYND